LLSCAAGVKLQFRQPAHISLAGIKRLAIAQGTGLKEASLLESKLIAKLDSIDYYFLFDKTELKDSLNRHQLTYQQIFESDSAALIDIGNQLDLDAMLFTELKVLEVDLEAVGSEDVEQKVWTGDYERNESGEIIEEENSNGEKVKKKKLKVKILEQPFQIRTATIEVLFKLIDFQLGSLFDSWEIVRNYVDNTLIGKESENLPNEREIKNILLDKAAHSLVEQIAPIDKIVKRQVETITAQPDSGAIYARQNEWNKALRYWKQVEANYPENAKVFYDLGLAYEAQGNYKMAEINYVKASLVDIENKMYLNALENIQKIWLEKSQRN